MSSVDFLAQASEPELLQALQAEDPRLRGNAACACGDRLRAGEWSRLEEMTHEALRAALSDQSEEVRFEAAIALAETKDTTATPLLVAAVRKRRTRLDALRALGRMGDRRAAEACQAILDGWFSSWADRLQAAAALCALGLEPGPARLEASLRSRRAEERAAAVHFLAEARHPRAFDLLCVCVLDPNCSERDAAVRALGVLGDPRATVVLGAIPEEPDKDLYLDAQEALQQLDRCAHPTTRSGQRGGA